MRDLATNSIGDDVIKTLWLQRLPTCTQQILATVNEPLDQLAVTADRIAEFTPPGVHAVKSANDTPGQSKSPDQDDLMTILCRLTETVTTLTQEISKIKHNSRSLSNTRSPTGNRSRSRSRPRNFDIPSEILDTWCWYHKVFQDKARVCKPDCQYEKYKQGNGLHRQ